MTSVANPTPATAPIVPDLKQQFLDTYAQETATTLRVLRAFPQDKSELQPHPKLRSARELAWVFVVEQAMASKALTEGFDWANPTPMPPAPASLEAIIGAFEQGCEQTRALVAGMRDEEFFQTVKFFTAPKTIGDIPKISFLWMTLCDQIHHRGQFSIYLRMADGRVPSIYGPTAVEPWH